MARGRVVRCSSFQRQLGRISWSAGIVKRKSDLILPIADGETISSRSPPARLPDFEKTERNKAGTRNNPRSGRQVLLNDAELNATVLAAIFR
jgi:hypothetical protein